MSVKPASAPLFGAVRIAVMMPVLLAFLAVPLLISTGLILAQGWQDRRHAEQALLANDIADLVMKVSVQWAQERSVTTTALAAPRSQSQPLKADIIAARGKSQAFLADLRSQAGGFAGPVQSALEHMDELRHHVDAALGQEQDDRPQALAKEWFAAMTHLIDQAQLIQTAAARQTKGLDKDLVELIALKDMAWVMVDYADRERARVGALVAAESPMNTAALTEMAGYRGRVEMAWARLAESRNSLTLSPAVAQSLDQVERHFMNEFKPLRDTVFQAGLAGGIYSVEAPQWLEQSGKAAQPLTALAQSLADQAESLAHQSENAAVRAFMLSFLALALAIPITVTAVMQVKGRVTRPISQLTSVMGELASGNIHVDFAVSTKDEMGELAQAFARFKQAQIQDRQRAQAEQARLEQQMLRKQRMENVIAEFEAEIGKVLDTVGQATDELQSAATAMSANAEQTNRQSAAVSAATEAASANVETVSAAGAQLNASIQEISAQVARSAQSAERAARDAETVNTRIESLAQAADRVGQIVQMIHAIAAQTNMLALNATIEAARAGDAGKGFAVVAGEVKGLANQTATATGEITAQISAIQAETQSAVEAIRAITRTILEVSQLTDAVAHSVEEQSAATGEISRSSEEASHGTARVAANIAGVAKAARETGQMAQNVNHAADTLIRQSRSLEERVATFLSALQDDTRPADSLL